MSRIILSILSTSALLFLPICAHASLMFTYDDTPIENNNDIFLSDAGTFGYYFEITSPVLITGLGWYDFEGDGLVESHQVAIWGGDIDDVFNPTDTTPLISVTVPAGTVAPLEDNFRTVSVETTELSAGIYTIGGFKTTGGDEMYVGQINTFTDIDPRFDFQYPLNTYQYDIDNPVPETEIRRPDGSPTALFGWMGPNMTIVPEPSTLVLAIAGLIALGLRRRTYS